MYPLTVGLRGYIQPRSHFFRPFGLFAEFDWGRGPVDFERSQQLKAYDIVNNVDGHVKNQWSKTFSLGFGVEWHYSTWGSIIFGWKFVDASAKSRWTAWGPFFPDYVNFDMYDASHNEIAITFRLGF